jgi:hypothetical protein
VRATGCVPLNLFNVLLVWRSQFAFESKATEGMHVQLQRMARVAPRMGRALASDRMQIKLGDPISATECCELHHCSLTEMSSQAHIHRFASQALQDGPGLKPAAKVFKPCSHMKPELTYRSSGFVQAAQPHLPRGAGHVYVFGTPFDARKPSSVAYIVAWTYYSRRSLAAGVLSPSPTSAEATGLFKLARPLEFPTVLDVVSRLLESGLPSPGPEGPSILNDSSGAVEVAGPSAMLGHVGDNGSEHKPRKRRRRMQNPDAVLQIFAYKAWWPCCGDDDGDSEQLPDDFVARIDLAGVKAISVKWEKPRQNQTQAKRAGTKS